MIKAGEDVCYRVEEVSVTGKTDRLCRRATDAYIFIMVTAFPLYTGLNGYFALNQDKFFFFALYTLCWALLLLILTVFRLACGERFRMRPADWAVMAFMAACILSTLLSPYASFLSLSTGRCDGLLTYLLYGCILLGVSRFGTARSCYIYAFGASYALCCLITALQLLGFNPLSLYPYGYNWYDPFFQEVAPFLGTTGNINTLSALHCLAIPMMLAGMLCDAGKRRFLLLIPAVLGVACMAAVGVASGILAHLVLVIVFFPIWVTELFRRKVPSIESDAAVRRFFRCAAGVSALVCTAAILGVYFWPDGGTVGELSMVLHGEIRDEFGSGRVGIWRSVLSVFGRHPLFGIGPDSLGNALNVQSKRYSEALGQMLYAYADNAHNEYLQLLVSFGLFGFLSFAAVQIITWVHISKNRRSAHLTAWICPGLLCYMVQAFFNIGLCIVTPLFCIFWALTLLPVPRPPAAAVTAKCNSD